MAVATPKHRRAGGSGPASHADAPSRGARARSAEADRHSLVAILDLVRSGRACTRLELESASSLGRAVVADRLATLARIGLLEEGVPGPSTGGRAPRTVRFRANAGSILVANLDRSSIGVGLADLSGRISFEHHEAADLTTGPDWIVDRLDTLFDWVLDQQEEKRDLWGIGIGVPGAVEALSDSAFSVPRVTFSPAWAESRAVERLIARHRAPVWVRGTVQMATMGELGPPRPARKENILFVDLGAEISAGLVSGGSLHCGAQGIAGQIGHIWAGDGNPVVCRCGNTGCLETLAGSDAIVRSAAEAAADGRSRRLAEILATEGEIGIDDIGLAAQLGDAASAQLLARSGRLVGVALAALTNAYNPSSIILDGELAQTGDILLAAIREAVYRHSNPLATRDLQIVRSNMGRSAGLAGAALIAVDELFRPELLGEWIAHGTPVRHPELPALLRLAEAALREPTGRGERPVRTTPAREPAR